MGHIISDKTKCSGCGAYFNVCPKNCIAMASDGEGFLEPDIDEAICVKCGLCVKVCPVLNNRPQNKVAKVYAAANKDENVCAAGAKMLRPHETQSNIEICKKM